MGAGAAILDQTHILQGSFPDPAGEKAPLPDTHLVVLFLFPRRLLLPLEQVAFGIPAAQNGFAPLAALQVELGVALPPLHDGREHASKLAAGKVIPRQLGELLVVPLRCLDEPGVWGRGSDWVASQSLG